MTFHADAPLNKVQGLRSWEHVSELRAKDARMPAGCLGCRGGRFKGLKKLGAQGYEVMIFYCDRKTRASLSSVWGYELFVILEGMHVLPLSHPLQPTAT